MDDLSWIKSIGTLVFAIALLAGTIWYGFHTWSDCLEENSFFTCSRMLN